ncbi:uncharacterized protein [Solanum lycopersicum]|uniref:uncharacterized protein n=1 Tax=Solanum lycopersicum TaxID=4081 RepID=UPI003747E464
MNVHYQRGKADVVADALSRMNIGSTTHVEDETKELVKYVHNWPDWVKTEQLKPDSLTQIIEVLTLKWEAINMDFVVGVQKTRRKHDSIWFIVDMMTTSANFIPVKSTYRAKDYARLYIDEIKNLSTLVKLSTVFHPHTDEQAERTIQTLEDMLRACLSLSIGMGPFEALYGRRCRSSVGWFEVRESSILGPEIIHEALEKVDLKISPMKGVMRKGKLSLRYVEPYEILHRVGEMANELAFPAELASVQQVFHVSMLKKYLGDPSSILPVEGLGVDEDLSYEEVPVEILDRQVKRLRNKELTTVKVLWRNHLVEGSMWETEADMRSLYPHLFSS